MKFYTNFIFGELLIFCLDVVVAAADDIDNFENQLRKLPLGFLVGIVFALGGMMILIILTFV